MGGTKLKQNIKIRTASGSVAVENRQSTQDAYAIIEAL